MSIVASASLTWLLIATETSEVVGGGILGGTATAHGKIGQRLKITLDDA